MATKKTTEEKQAEETKKRGRAKKVAEKKAEEKIEVEAVEKKKRGRPKKVKEESTKAKDVTGNGNLVPFDQRTEEEQRKIRTKGGVASGIARRRKKELREFTRDFLMQEAVPQLKGNMNMLGVEAEQMTNMAAMVLRLFSKAVNQGDLNAARTVIEWAGMAPLQQERENEAIAKMSQVMQWASGEEKKDEEDTGVVFYIPFNNRDIVTDEELVTVNEES